MRRLPVAMLAAMALFGLLAGALATAARAVDDTKGRAAGLDGGARSVEELVAQLLRALRARDRDALRGLRVTETEYREIILPGSVKPGETPLQYAPDFVEFLWGSLNAKNYYGERDIVGAYGGKTFALRKTSFTGGDREYASYVSRGRLNLTLADEQGNEVLIEMGPIAQVGERYKFISFVRN